MPEKQIQISRQGVLLGTLAETEARDLLVVGFLKLDDQFRADESDGWKSLRDFHILDERPSSGGSWLLQATQSLISVKDVVAGSAGEVLDKVKNFAGATRSNVTEVSEKLLSGFIPQIQVIINDLAQIKPFLALQKGVSDDALMLKVFGAAYDCLPKPVCRFVSEQQFVAFCMKHRGQLLSPPTSKPS